MGDRPVVDANPHGPYKSDYLDRVRRVNGRMGTVSRRYPAREAGAWCLFCFDPVLNENPHSYSLRAWPCWRTTVSSRCAKLLAVFSLTNSHPNRTCRDQEWAFLWSRRPWISWTKILFITVSQNSRMVNRAQECEVDPLSITPRARNPVDISGIPDTLFPSAYLPD